MITFPYFGFYAKICIAPFNIFPVFFFIKASHNFIQSLGTISPEYSAASGLNHCLGATTILSGFVFSQAPHHENVLLAIMLWWQFRISSKSK